MEILTAYDRVKHIAYDEFVQEAMKQFTEFDLRHGYPTIADCKVILREVAEKMKGGEVK